MKAYFRTFGCKVSAADTDSIALLLRKHGWEVVSTPEESDAVIVNSCTVTASGDARMQTELRRIRRKAPDTVILLTGCFAQAFPQKAGQLPEADIITGIRDYSSIPDLLSAYLADRKKRCEIRQFSAADTFEELPQGTDAGHTRAFLKIQDGCNRFCTYCIIPYARGRCRSRSPESITREVSRLTAEGFREIVLCGINLACWGAEYNMNIADAVRLCAGAGAERIRLGSMEPDGLTEDVLCQLAAVPALCPHFHISVQSGCDRILRRMHRGYSCEEYAALLERIRILFPRCAVTTDIMTGFPGETEEDFSETMLFAEKMAFSQIHVFRYSPRPGTPASSMPDQVTEAEKKLRSDRLSLLSEQMHTAYLSGFIGKTLPVLFERPKTENFQTGHADNYAVVCVPGTENLRGKLLHVRITGMTTGKLLGELV